MEVLSMAAEPLLSATFEWMIQKLNDYICSNVHADLDNWRTLLRQISSLLKDAEEKQLSEDNYVKTWLDDLKDLAYDMEDIFEEFKAGADVQSNLIAKPQQASSSRFIPATCFSCFKGNDLNFDSETISKVKSISMRLQSMKDSSITLGLVSLTVQAGERPNKTNAARHTTSLPDSHIYGRESDKANILRELLNDEGNSKGYSVIPIVGMGGVGKTTLAQLIYNEVEEGCFELKVWVCISNQFDILSITRTILKAVLNDQCDSEDLNLLQEKLKEKLSCKFLLVLDDVWNDVHLKWEELQKPFKSGLAGSKIIVTTRNERVAVIMGGKDKIHQLKKLEFEQCLPIVAQHALGEENFDAHPSLKEVGEEIVKRCNGLPLVAKVLGGLLCGKLEVRDWEYILNNKMLNLQVGKSGILPPLMLSYHDLPPYLKQCFAYCALFPKDYPFKEDELLMLWMAEGLLQRKLGEQNQLEEIGHQYFRELLSKSFFQQSSGNALEYVMHDLIHDLAQFVAGRTYYNLKNMWEVDEKSEVKFEKVRHVSFYCESYNMFEKFKVLTEMKSLRSLIPANPRAGWCHLAKTVVLDWIPKLRCLRALSLQGYSIRKLPDSIRDLKCLKYLNLSETWIQSLPESIVFLLQLQTLLLFDCKRFSKFPVKIGNLINLHHLDIRGRNSLREMPSGIANLKDLLTLGKFIVGKENGSIKLFDLKNFLQLKGELSILDLHNVMDVDDAKKANLDKINGLDWLLLEWTNDFGNSRNEDKEMQVLSSLEPHLKLKSLIISCYGGKEFPSWIGKKTFSNLSYLKLCKCRRSTSLPSLGQLAALKELIVQDMEAIEIVDSKFYGHGTFQSLEKLEFHGMLVWKEWTSTTGGAVGFPCLRELVIVNCPKLIGPLPSHFSCLINLMIRSCPKLRCSSSMSLQSLQKLNIEDCNVALLKSLADLTSLTSLTIKRISGLVCLSKSFIESLITVEKVEIEECLELTCLWEEGAEIENLARLETMNIKKCPRFVSLIGKEQGLLPFNLKHLTFSDCKALESLTDAMMMKVDGSSSSNNMLRLESLSIYNCDSLKSLLDGVLLQDDGNNNSNLESLIIQKLPSLNSVGSGHLPACLKKFIVYDCKGLESFLERMLQHCTGLESIQIRGCEVLRSLSLDGLSNLRHLTISQCPGLEHIPNRSLPLNLTDLEILNCQNLNSLPNTMNELTSIQNLRISRCSGIKFIPDGGLPLNLIKLILFECRNLNSLPNTMNELTSLQRLIIAFCPGIRAIPDGGFPPNLTFLDFCEHLMQPTVEWGLHNLTSLQELRIYNTCPPDIVLPSSLTYLRIKSAMNLKSIPRRLLQHLNSLQYLMIYSCPKLRSLPRKGLPPSLEFLEIRDCPLLKRQRFEEKGEYWSLTRTIPCVQIDLSFVD